MLGTLTKFFFETNNCKCHNLIRLPLPSGRLDRRRHARAEISGTAARSSAGIEFVRCEEELHDCFLFVRFGVRYLESRARQMQQCFADARARRHLLHMLRVVEQRVDRPQKSNGMYIILYAWNATLREAGIHELAQDLGRVERTPIGFDHCRGDTVGKQWELQGRQFLPENPHCRKDDAQRIKAWHSRALRRVRTVGGVQLQTSSRNQTSGLDKISGATKQV
mmetsp:Transcript_14822/g.45262  ORF Transcript_14822/g.45262 Transcript_14822/m.45262 type:complete len:222 (+) Transcript_14822:2834-3499(+)